MLDYPKTFTEGNPYTLFRRNFSDNRKTFYILRSQVRRRQTDHVEAADLQQRPAPATCQGTSPPG
jgi:hypothetical protein